MTRDDLTALVRSVAEAAARCVGAEPRHTDGLLDLRGPHFTGRRQVVTLTARAGGWCAKGRAEGPTIAAENPAINAAAVLALRERLTAQRDERARLLATDEAALRTLDETARLYDARALAEAIGEVCAQLNCDADHWTRVMRNELSAMGRGDAPWSRAEIAKVDGSFADACDAILRRRAGGEP